MNMVLGGLEMIIRVNWFGMCIPAEPRSMILPGPCGRQFAGVIAGGDGKGFGIRVPALVDILLKELRVQSTVSLQAHR